MARAARAFVLLLATTIAAPSLAASRPAVYGERGMVVAPEPLAADVGLRVLRNGGNAVDAAIATAFALAVTYPRAGALGGGGFALVRRAGGTGYDAIDFRETAPAAAKPDLFRDDAGRPAAARAQEGGLAVGVPGLVAGLATLHEAGGSRPWSELIGPAIAFAERGYPLSRRSAERLAREAGRLGRDGAARAIFFVGDVPRREGDVLVQTDLAATLRRIAREGVRGFYAGPVAASIVRAVTQAGGVMTPADLASYRAVPRTPLTGTYRGYPIVVFPPPSSGGVTLLQILGMLERYDLATSGPGSSLTVHRMAEAERRAFADRARWLGDPDFARVPVAGLLDPGYLARRAAGIADDAATASAALGPGDPTPESGGDTLHLSVADARGGAVAMTVTLNSWFGAAIVAPGTGVLLNNEMDDFAIAPSTSNQFGLLGGAANAVAGRKRPLSSMGPTIVEHPSRGARPRLVLGSPGGPTIITTIAQVIANVVDHGMDIQEAVDAPRFHHQGQPDRLDHEVRAFPADVARALTARGHALAPREPIGNVAVIATGAPDGAWLGASDPRDEGEAKGY